MIRDQSGALFHVKFFALHSLSLASALAADQTWTGQIGDSMCDADHTAMTDGGNKVDPDDCTLTCVKGGGKFLFVSNGQVFSIANQDLGHLTKHAGHNIKMIGSLDLMAKTITVSKVEMNRQHDEHDHRRRLKEAVGERAALIAAGVVPGGRGHALTTDVWRCDFTLLGSGDLKMRYGRLKYRNLRAYRAAPFDAPLRVAAQDLHSPLRAGPLHQRQSNG